MNRTGTRSRIVWLVVVLLALSFSSTRAATLSFSGYDWTIKDSGNSAWGPGPNYFSTNPSNVWVDAQGRLHLRIEKRTGRWFCAEIVSQRSFGHGTYRVFLDSPVDNLDPNVTLGLFTWHDTDPAFANREVDVEMARWGNAADTNNAQFVVQPWEPPGQMVRFRIPPSLTNTTHSFSWQTNRVDFTSHANHFVVPPGTNTVISEWTYNLAGVPPAGGENFRFNLWLFQGNAPQNGLSTEVIISRFVFVPTIIPPPRPTSLQLLPGGEFQLAYQGETQLTYQVTSSAGLTNWQMRSTIVATNGVIEYTDSAATNAAQQFYRLVVPPQ